MACIYFSYRKNIICIVHSLQMSFPLAGLLAANISQGILPNAQMYSAILSVDTKTCSCI